MMTLHKIIEGINKFAKWASYGWVNYSSCGEYLIQPYAYMGIELSRR